VIARIGWAGVLPLALAVGGAVVTHPTSAVTIGLTTAVWFLAERLGTPEGRRSLVPALRTLAIGGAAGAVLLLPLIVAAADATETVTEFPRDFGVTPLAQAIGYAVGAPYGGILDPAFLDAQAWIFALSVAGLAASLLLRRNAAVVAVFAVWAAVLIGFLMDVDLGPLRTVTGIYYNSYVRISGGLALVQWLAAGLALALVAESVARGVTALRRREPVRWLRPSVAALLLLGFLLAVALPYAHTNSDALAERYSDPEFIRVDQDDLDAAEYVSERIGPGERVMNNANDGSSYGYVYHGLPIVENAALGSAKAPYTVDLLQSFRDLNEDDEIRALACDLRITWAIADAEAPPIWAPVERYPWAQDGLFSVAPGLQDLDEVDNVEAVQQFGDVTVYRIDLDGVGCGSGDEEE
jgi:hypothetical protein